MIAGMPKKTGDVVPHQGINEEQKNKDGNGLTKATPSSFQKQDDKRRPTLTDNLHNVRQPGPPFPNKS